MRVSLALLFTLSLFSIGCASAPHAAVGNTSIPDPDGKDLKVEWPDLRKADWLPPGRDTSADRAVIVSIEKYLDGVHVGRIPGAVENGKAWEQFFVHGQGMKTGSQVRWLFDGQATKENIDDAVDDAVRDTEASGGRLWFVFIGHGTRVGKESVLLGVDVQATSSSAKHRGVSTPGLLRKLRHLRAATVVFDACFSGPLLNGFEFNAGTQGFEVFEDGVPGNVSVFSAAGQNERAGQLPKGARPAYSYLLLGALNGWGDSDRNDVITESEAHQYVTTTMARIIHSRSQTPSLQSHRDYEVLARGDANEPSISIEPQTVASGSETPVAPPPEGLRPLAPQVRQALRERALFDRCLARTRDRQAVERALGGADAAVPDRTDRPHPVGRGGADAIAWGGRSSSS